MAVKPAPTAINGATKEATSCACATRQSGFVVFLDRAARKKLTNEQMSLKRRRWHATSRIDRVLRLSPDQRPAVRTLRRCVASNMDPLARPMMR